MIAEYEDVNRKMFYNSYNCESWGIDKATAEQHEKDGKTKVMVLVNLVSGDQDELYFDSYIGAEHFCNMLAGIED